MKLLVTIDSNTFTRQVDPKKGAQAARDIVALGYETETEDGVIAIYPPHRIAHVQVFPEATDPKPNKSKKASAK